MRTVISLIFIVTSSFLFAQDAVVATRIEVGPGPEDFVLDILSGDHRLLVSCSSRRKVEEAYAEIFEINLVSGKKGIFPRAGEPDSLYFNPHGIDLRMVNGKQLLFVISHNNALEKHSVYVYEVAKDHLSFIREHHSPLYVSPNDVTALSDGSFFITNDSGKRNSFLEKLLVLRCANVVYTDKDGKASIAIKKLAYSNGIAVKGDENLYVSATQKKELLEYKLEKNNKPVLTKKLPRVKGYDNITFHGEKLVLTSHPNFIKFMRHYKSPDKKSPVKVHLIDVENNTEKTVFSNNGHLISAASTALIYKNKLYISQVFDPFILVYPLE
jgi:arylesterase / paraoxonase